MNETNVKEIGFVYKTSIILACLVLMIASVACTGWFFYSWLGGIPGIVGAFVGCAVQIMAYGFSGVVVKQVGGLLRVVLIMLIASALGLSVLSSYATLTGYFTALQQDKQAKDSLAAKKDLALQTALEQRIQLLESMSRDVDIGSDAAGQGLAEKYRTQANKFLKDNAATRSEIDEQLAKVEAMIQSDMLAESTPQASSPIDGLSSVLGNQSITIMILCLWLAIMFDALPIAGITLLEGKVKHLKKETAEAFPAAPEPESDALLATTFIEESNNPIVLEIEAQKDKSTNEITAQEDKEDELRILTNICSSDLNASKAFYVDLLEFEIKYDSDWYVQLCSPFDTKTEFGVIQQDHELIPQGYRQSPNGMYLTFVVPDVNHTYERALELGIDIIQEPRNEFYGQRRFLAREPSGCLVDICSPWEYEEA